MRNQTIKLYQVKDVSIEREFQFEHALNLLRLQKEKNLQLWSIKNKDWEFVDNEIRRRKKNTEKSEEQIED